MKKNHVFSTCIQNPYLYISNFPKTEKPKFSFSVKQHFLHYKYKQHFGVKGLLQAVCNVIVLIITYNSREQALPSLKMVWWSNSLGLVATWCRQKSDLYL